MGSIFSYFYSSEKPPPTKDEGTGQEQVQAVKEDLEAQNQNECQLDDILVDSKVPPDVGPDIEEVEVEDQILSSAANSQSKQIEDLKLPSKAEQNPVAEEWEEEEEEVPDEEEEDDEEVELACSLESAPYEGEDKNLIVFGTTSLEIKPQVIDKTFDALTIPNGLKEEEEEEEEEEEDDEVNYVPGTLVVDPSRRSNS